MLQHGLSFSLLKKCKSLGCFGSLCREDDQSSKARQEVVLDVLHQPKPDSILADDLASDNSQKSHPTSMLGNEVKSPFNCGAAACCMEGTVDGGMEDDDQDAVTELIGTLNAITLSRLLHRNAQRSVVAATAL